MFGYAALCGSSTGGTFGGMHGEFDDGRREGAFPKSFFTGLLTEVPLRHRIYASIDQAKELQDNILQMFDLIDATPGGRPQVMGRTWSPTKESWTSVPADLELAQPLLWRLARKISRPIFRLDVFDGMWYGTVCDRLPPVPLAMSGLLVEWLRADRHSYLVKEVTPAQGVDLRSATTVNSGPTSFVCFYSFAPTADDAKFTP